MQQLPVDKCIDVLNVFCADSDDELWTNKIVAKVVQTTGSKDSPKIKEAIKLLNKSKILEIKKLGLQKRQQLLTNWGRNIVFLIKSINDANNNFSDLISKVYRYQELLENDYRFRRTLEKDKWKKDDIDSFFELYKTLTDIVDLYITCVLSLIISRFIKLMSDTRSNELSKRMLTTLVTNEIIKMSDVFARLNIGSIGGEESDSNNSGQKQRYFIRGLSEEEINQLGISEELKSKLDNDNYYMRSTSNLTNPFFHQMEKIFAFDYLAENESLMKEAIYLIKAMISILGLSKNELEMRRKLLIFDFDLLEESNKGKKIYANNYLRLQKIYQEMIEPE